jgi:hypothetical protein
MPRYEVTFELDIEASSPEQAAVIARDRMLDPDETLFADIHEYAYCADADDWFPDDGHGWQARFEKPPGVRPSAMIAFERLRQADAQRD